MQPSRDVADPQGPAHAPQDRAEGTFTFEELSKVLELIRKGAIDVDGIDSIPTLDPILTDWTYEQFEQDMLAAQGHADSTAYNRCKYIRFLESFEEAPVELRPPDEESWIEHVAVRRANGATGAALNHYRKALKSLLKFLDRRAGHEVPMWRSLNSQFTEAKPVWTLPPDELVPKFWLTDRWEGVDPVMGMTYSYIFHYGFHMGVRPPSELAVLDVDDVDFEGRRVIVTEPKKGGNRRLVENVPKYVLSSPTSKSLRNYVDHWRPKVDAGTSDALFLNGHGERFSVRSLGNNLSQLGKRIWPKFKPYTMRRWFATQLLISSGFNVYIVAQALGDTVATVEEHYLDAAKARAAMDGQGHLPRLMGVRE